MLVPNSGLGELSTSREFADGRLLANESGTSLAAPHIAHLAASILIEYPQADRDFIRALLVAHASAPEACKDLFEDDNLMRRVCGYGRVDSRALFRSLENEATMVAQGQIMNKNHHFYEVPIPDDFLSGGRRLREISIGMSFTPYVRSTRVSYKANRIDNLLPPPISTMSLKCSIKPLRKMNMIVFLNLAAIVLLAALCAARGLCRRQLGNSPNSILVQN